MEPLSVVVRKESGALEYIMLMEESHDEDANLRKQRFG